MMRLLSWPLVLSVLTVAGGAPLLYSLGFSGWTVTCALATAVAFIGVVAHLIGSWRVGHAI